MKMYNKLICLLMALILFMATTPMSAQTPSDSLPRQMIAPAQSLSAYIQEALQRSPMLTATEHEIEAIREEIKLQKKSWLDNVHIDANTRYGLFNQISINNPGAGFPDDIYMSNREQFNYYTGISVKIPLSDFTNRGNKINVLKSKQAQTEMRKKQLEQEITQNIVDLYFRMMSSRETMRSYQELIQTININYRRGINEVANGMITFTAFSNIVESKARAEEAFSRAKNDYCAHFYMLNYLSGNDKTCGEHDDTNSIY